MCLRHDVTRQESKSASRVFPSGMETGIIGVKTDHTGLPLTGGLDPMGSIRLSSVTKFWSFVRTKSGWDDGLEQEERCRMRGMFVGKCSTTDSTSTFLRRSSIPTFNSGSLVKVSEEVR